MGERLKELTSAKRIFPQIAALKENCRVCKWEKLLTVPLYTGMENDW